MPYIILPKTSLSDPVDSNRMFRKPQNCEPCKVSEMLLMKALKWAPKTDKCQS
jgi:hypothetical protein